MEDAQNKPPSPSEDTRESVLPVSHVSPSLANHHQTGGFGGNRRGLNNPFLFDRNHLRLNQFPYPPPARSVNRSNTPRGRARHTLAVMDEYADIGFHPLRASVALPDGANVMAEKNAETPLEDYLMTTSDDSITPPLAGRNAVHSPGIAFGQTSNLQSGRSLGDPAIICGLSRAFHSPGMTDILNPSSPFEIASGYGHHPLWTRTKAHNHQTSTHQPLLNLPPPPNPSPTLTPYSEISTIRSSSLGEQRLFHINTLYNHCLEASTTHLSSRRRHQHISSRRYHPYSPPRQYDSRSSSNLRSNQSTTLMDNISAICTHVWRKARNDGMAPHRAEADAVRVMRDLYTWGEVVIRGLEEEGDAEVEMEGHDRWSLFDEESEGIKVGEAAKELCSWFGDRRAWRACENIVGLLRELEEKEFGRQGERGSESTVGIL